MGLRNSGIIILFMTMFLVMAGFGIILPILPFFSLNLGATSFQIGLLMASYSLMQFIFSPVWGSLSDKYGRKPIILIGLAGFAVSFVLFGIADSLLMLFASRILGGILSSACLPTAMAYVADVTDTENRGHGMGLMGAAMGLGVIVGPAIGSLFSILHFSAPFFFSAVLAVINLLFAAIFLKESKKKRSRSEVEYNRFKHLLSLRGFLAFAFFLVFVVSFSTANFEGTFSLFAKDKLNFGAVEMGWIFVSMGVVIVIIQGMLIGRLIKRFGEENIVKIGLILSSIGYLLTIFSYDFISLMIFVGIASAGAGLCRPSLASLISKRTEIDEGATMGAMQSIDSLGRIAGPIFGGFALAMHSNLPYLSGSAVNFLFWIALLFI
ncbi:MFS transporter [Candidatus Saganbacteria bacterium]|nr:MFS transporter [Candidatus Saganbacteria bacterium]